MNPVTRTEDELGTIMTPVDDWTLAEMNMALSALASFGWMMREFRRQTAPFGEFESGLGELITPHVNKLEEILDKLRKAFDAAEMEEFKRRRTAREGTTKDGGAQ